MTVPIGTLTDLKRRPTPACWNAAEIAMIYAALGEKAQALAWLERSYDERFNPRVLLRRASTRCAPTHDSGTW